MNLDDLDRILISEKQMETSTSFTREVMMRVEMEAARRRSVPFPWISLAASILVTAVLALRIFPSDSVLRMAYRMSYAAGSWLMALPETASGSALLPALVSLLGTFLLVWISLRLAGAGS